jgi:hypothetical protein
MEKLYREATKLLEKEIKEVVERGEIDPGSLDVMYKVLDNIKDISIICAMKKEEDDYSERYMYDDDSYARGRYSRRGYAHRGSYEGSYDDSYGRGSYRGYSRTEELENMLRDAKTEKERELIRQLMEAKQN